MSEMRLPDQVRSAIANFVALVPEDSREMEEVILRVLAFVHARRAARGIAPPDWIIRLPCYPPRAEDVRSLIETLRPIIGDQQEGQRWIEAIESVLREMEGAPPSRSEDD